VVTQVVTQRLWQGCSAVALAILCLGCPGHSANTTVRQGNAPAPAGVDLQVVTEGLAEGDTLEVKVFGEPDISGPYRVRSDGTISMPLAGRVLVRGLTPDQAAEAIRRAYANGFLADPEVMVSVQSAQSKKFYVMGAVSRPGVFDYAPDMNILRAIIMAGGFAPSAAHNDVLLTRAVNGTDVRMEIPVDDISQGKEKNVPVLPGDLIYVPTSIL
jgi:protein involved in polysaccharide export with SLBB domain